MTLGTCTVVAAAIPHRAGQNHGAFGSKPLRRGPYDAACKTHDLRSLRCPELAYPGTELKLKVFLCALMNFILSMFILSMFQVD